MRMLLSTVAFHSLHTHTEQDYIEITLYKKRKGWKSVITTNESSTLCSAIRRKNRISTCLWQPFRENERVAPQMKKLINQWLQWLHCARRTQCHAKPFSRCVLYVPQRGDGGRKEKHGRTNRSWENATQLVSVPFLHGRRKKRQSQTDWCQSNWIDRRSFDSNQADGRRVSLCWWLATCVTRERCW